jgi:hypothetical protein
MGKLDKSIRDRVNELESMTDLHSAPLAMSVPPYFNSSRKIIFAHNMSHAVNIVNPDMNNVYTGFEKIFGKYSEMFEEADKNWEVVKKFQRNKYNYILVVYNKKEKIYDVIERTGFEEFSEGYSAKYNNSYLDNLDIGSEIAKGDTIKKSISFDEYNNYCYGKNLNTLFTISTTTEEDCITLMNGAEKMMDTYRIHTIKVPFNRDEVMLNIHGDRKIYKPFPMVGERTVDGILLSIRKIPNSSMLYSGKDKHLMKMAQGDITRYIDGKVIDFTIYSNNPMSDLPDSFAYDQIRELSKEQRKFYLDVFNYMSDLVNNEGPDSYMCGSEVRYWMTKASKFVDSSAYFSDMDNVFGHVIMEFKILQRQHLVPGSKLTGLAGRLCS